MTNPPKVETTTVTTTTTAPPETEAKFILAQKRFWFALLSLAAWLVVLVYVNGATWPEALSDDKTIGLVATIVAMLGLSGVFLSAFKGSKRTVFSRLAEELSRTPQVTEVERVTVGPVPGTPGKAPERPRGGSERGYAGVGVLGGVALGLLGLWLASMATGCAALRAREVEGDVVDIAVDPGPPCIVTVASDGQIVSTVIGRKRACNVTVEKPPDPEPANEPAPEPPDEGARS